MSINLAENFANKKLVTVFSDIANFGSIAESKSNAFSNIESDEVCFTFNHEKYAENDVEQDVVSLYLVDSRGNVVQVLDGGYSKSLEYLILSTKKELQNQINTLKTQIENLGGCNCYPGSSSEPKETFVWENIYENTIIINKGLKRKFYVNRGTLKTIPGNIAYPLDYDGIKFINNGYQLQLTFIKDKENSCYSYQCGDVAGRSTVDVYCNEVYVDSFDVTVNHVDSEITTPIPSSDDPMPESSASPTPEVKEIVEWKNIESNTDIVYVGTTNYINKGSITSTSNRVGFASSDIHFDQSGTTKLLFEKGITCWKYIPENVPGKNTVTAYYKDQELGSFEVTVIEFSETAKTYVWSNIEENNNTRFAGNIETYNIDKGRIKEEITNTIVDFNDPVLRFEQSGDIDLSIEKGTDCWTYKCGNTLGTSEVIAYYNDIVIGSFYVEVNDGYDKLIWNNIESNSTTIYTPTEDIYYINKGTLKTIYGTVCPYNQPGLSFNVSVISGNPGITITQDESCYKYSCDNNSGSVKITAMYNNEELGSFNVQIYKKEDVRWDEITKNDVNEYVSDSATTHYIDQGLLKDHAQDVIIDYNSERLIFTSFGAIPLTIERGEKCYSFKCGTDTGTATIMVYYVLESGQKKKLGDINVLIKTRAIDTWSLKWNKPIIAPSKQYLSEPGKPQNDTIDFSIMHNGQFLPSSEKNAYISFTSTDSTVARIIKPLGTSNKWTLQWGPNTGDATISCKHDENGFIISTFTIKVIIEEGPSTSTTRNPLLSPFPGGSDEFSEPPID